jgi:hypothetical protein
MRYMIGTTREELEIVRRIIAVAGGGGEELGELGSGASLLERTVSLSDRTIDWIHKYSTE